MSSSGALNREGHRRQRARSGDGFWRARILAGCLGLAVMCQAASPDWQAVLASDAADSSVWPNRISRANGDQWLAEHHDRIRLMRPRLLVINFANRTPRPHLDKLVQDLIAALAESSRYRGYQNADAPAFLQYRLFKFVDLREAGNPQPTSSHFPLKREVKEGFNVDYGAFFSAAFAAQLGVRDPSAGGRFLRLDELVERGLVHELWFTLDHDDSVRAFECVELKPQYDESFVPHSSKFVQAGNGGDPDQQWTGRSLRLGCINATRGIGCFLESLSHSIEGMANSKAIPYFTRYFHEFAAHDLDKRFGDFPWPSFYPLWGEDKGVHYPDPSTAVVRFGPRTYTLTNYVAYGGNAHFPPNGRRHYDLENTNAVYSTIEDWRSGRGENGRDRAVLWTNERFARYREQAPDCMGPWLIYWRQNFPGFGNLQKDDAGRPMKNWWPFLFY